MKIAISGLSGVGSSTTAKLVSEQLNLPMSNFTFRNLASEYGVPWQELLRRAKTEPEIDLDLDKRLIEFAHRHDRYLISTDFACWLDSPSVYQRVGLNRGAEFDLKIWLEASLEVRAKRMMERENRPLAQLLIEEHDRDQQARDRLLKLYGIDLLDRSKIDWVLNTENLTLPMVVDLIVERARLIESKK